MNKSLSELYAIPFPEVEENPERAPGEISEKLLKQYLRTLPTVKAGSLDVKVLPGLPEGAWFLVDLREEENPMTNDNNGVTILETQEEVNAYHKGWWGGEDTVLTKEQIKALLEGKYLIFNDGEYSHSLRIEE